PIDQPPRERHRPDHHRDEDRKAPNCTSDNFEWVANIRGWTHIVQGYCRFPIIAIATTPAVNAPNGSLAWLPRGICSFEQLGASVDRASVGHVNSEAFTKLNHCTHYRFQFHRPVRFQILQH